MEVVFSLLRQRKSTDSSHHLQSRIRKYDPSLASAAVAHQEAVDAMCVNIGGYKIDLEHCAYNGDSTLDAIVDVGPFPETIKHQAKAAQGLTRIRLLGDGPYALTDLLLLASVAGAIGEDDGIVVIHEAARAAIPVGVLLPPPLEGQRMSIIMQYPLGLLLVGHSKYELEGDPGVWMTTHASHLLGLDELAMHVASHAHGEKAMRLFDQLQRYATSTPFAPGDTAQVGAGQSIRFSRPAHQLPFMDSVHDWLVIESA